MAEQQAKIKSVEQLEAFRATLLTFIERAAITLSGVDFTIKRARQWVEVDQLQHWKVEHRKRSRQLEQAQQERLTARLSTLRDSTTDQDRAVRKAQAALEEAEQKLRKIKHWTREFGRTFLGPQRPVSILEDFVHTELRKGTAHLRETITILDDYLHTPPPPTAP